jgi:hypothetical protein
MPHPCHRPNDEDLSSGTPGTHHGWGIPFRDRTQARPTGTIEICFAI